MPSDRLLGAVTRFNVSPKLANSGVGRSRRVRPRVLRVLASSRKAIFKFVVECADDLDEVADLQDEFGLQPIWVMPQGQTAEQIAAVMRAIADPVLDRGWNLSMRLHVALGGTERGR